MLITEEIEAQMLTGYHGNADMKQFAVQLNSP
jgi:hypothetical protein